MRLKVPNRTPLRGFTLLELMIVLILIGIMTGLIIPEMRGTFEEALLRSTARKLMDVFNLASSRAITLNQVQRVHFDRTLTHYVVESQPRSGAGESSAPSFNDIPGGQGELDHRITIEIHKPSEEPSANPDEGPAYVSGDQLGKSHREETLAFYPDGTADGVDILLRDRAGFRLGLRINPITARVRMMELERQ